MKLHSGKMSRLLACLLALLLLPMPQTMAEEEEMPTGVVDTFVQEKMEKQQTAEEAAFEAGAANGAYYADFSFGGTRTLSGISTTLSLYANLPKYARPTSAVLCLCYTASDLILSDISSLTFYMNGTPFGSRQIEVRADEAQTVLYVTVPVELLQTGYNLLELLSYVRLTDDEGCKDDYNGANWVKIADTTCLRIFYEISDDADELYMYPYPFVSLMDTTGAKSAVVTSDAADEAELTAAMTLLAGLGSSVSSSNAVEFCRLSETERENRIYVGLKENTPANLLALLSQEVPQTGALVERVMDGDVNYLLIIANEPAALNEGACLMSDTARVTQLHTARTYVSVGEAAQYAQASATSGLALNGQYTVKDILGAGMSFSGPFAQETTVYLPVADDYVLSSESRFSFDIRYSENLDFDRSLVTFYWGTDIPLYSHKLSKDGATGETLTFSVPADAIGETGRSMTIVFDLEIKDLDCTVRSLNTPWAYIAATSTLYLPQGKNTSLSLSSLPAPFQVSGKISRTAVLLSDNPTKTEMTLAGRVMAVLGSGSSPYGELKAIKASNFSREKYGEYNLLVVGLSEENNFLSQINSSLLFAYSPDMFQLAESNKLVMNTDYARNAGVMQIFTSPYSENAAVLAVTASTQMGLENLLETLSTERGRWALGKEALVVDPYGGTSSYQFTVSVTGSQSDEKPTFTEVVLENREPMMLLMVGMGCMALLLIAVVLVLVRIQRRKKYDEN